MEEYKTKFTCNIDTSTLPAGTITHNFSVLMENQLAFHRDHQYEMALLRYDIYNSIKNISAENLNNEIRIDPALGSFVTITITDGVYSISELNTAIKTKINALGYDANNFSIIGDFNILKVLLNLGAGWRVDFSGNSLYKILGYNQIIYDYNLGNPNIAPNKADISNGINALSVNCSLVDTRWNMANANKNDSLYILPINAQSGGLLSAVIQNPLYKRMIHGDYLHSIDIRICSQDCRTNVNLNDEDVSLTLHIREI
jgi:hypothetical protein